MRDDDLMGHPALARIARWGRRIREFDAAHPWLADAGGVVLLYSVVGFPDLTQTELPRELPMLASAQLPEILAFQAGLILPLLLRRRYPAVAFGLIAAVFTAQWLLGVGLRADVALLVALFNLVLHERLVQLRWALPVAAVAAGLVTFRLSPAVHWADALFITLSAVTAAAALGLTVRLRRNQLEALRERAARLEIERDQRSQLAAATERTRIAREMHDVLGHNLSVIVTLADGGANAVNPERRVEALHLIGDVGRRALNDVRQVLGVLRAPEEVAGRAPQPDIAAIGPLCDQIRAAGPAVVYHSSGALPELDPTLQLAVYRVVQEALTNSLRHAGASTRINLSLGADATTVQIAVRDSGPADGAPPPSPSRIHDGRGLAGIRERAAAFHGTAAAGPQPGGGWLTTATLRRPTPGGSTPGGLPA